MTAAVEERPVASTSDAGRLRAAAAVAERVGIDRQVVLSVWQFTPEAMAREHRFEQSDRRKAIIDNARNAVRDGRPLAAREQHGELDPVEAFDQGRRVESYRAREPIDYYAKHKRITPRQAEVARRFREDWEIGIVGARDPEAGTGSSGSSGGYSQAQLIAAENYAGAVERLGKVFRPIVELVVLNGEWLDDIAKRRVDSEASARVRAMHDQLQWQLRSGLDVLGDAYGEPAEIIAETVPLGQDASVRIEYRHEADGTLSAIRHSGLPWLASGKTLGHLREQARGLKVKNKRLVEVVGS